MDIKQFFTHHHNLGIIIICLLITVILINYEEHKLLTFDSHPEYTYKNKVSQSELDVKASKYASHADIILHHSSIILSLVTFCFILNYITTSPKLQKLRKFSNALVNIIFIFLPVYMLGLSFYMCYAIVTDYQQANQNDPSVITNHLVVITIVTILMFISTYEMFEYDYKHYIKHI